MEFTTPKGTKIPITMLPQWKKDKQTDKWIEMPPTPYMNVAYRVMWFREEHPNWTIETKIESHTTNSVVFSAAIKDDSGRTLQVAHKYDFMANEKDDAFFDRAETQAIGRALANLGFGTQFALSDLSEGDKLADAPALPQAKAPVPEMVKTPGITGGSKLDQFNQALKQAPNHAPQAPSTDGYKTQYDKTGGVKLASAAQIKRLWAIALGKNMSPQEINRMLADTYGFTDPKQLNWKQYKEFTEFLETCQAQEEQPPMPTEMPADMVEQMNDIPF